MQHLMQTALYDRQVPGDPHRVIPPPRPGAQERSVAHLGQVLHAHVAELQRGPNRIDCLHLRCSALKPHRSHSSAYRGPSFSAGSTVLTSSGRSDRTAQSASDSLSMKKLVATPSVL